MIICDCDNVLAHDEWRIRMVDWDCEDLSLRYHDYHIASKFDTAYNQGLIPPHPHPIAIFTRMPERYRPVRRDWLLRRNIRYNFLYMARDGDYRSAPDIKADMLRRLFRVTNLPPEKFFAYDDQEDVLAVYRQMGVRGCQVKLHDTTALVPPLELVMKA